MKDKSAPPSPDSGGEMPKTNWRHLFEIYGDKPFMVRQGEPFIPAVIIAVCGPLPKSFIEVVVIVLPLLGSTASAVLLQTRAVTRQRDYELAWQAYDHLMSQIDLMIADVKGKGLSPQAVEAECTRIAQVLIDGRKQIENSLIMTTTTPQ